jgi:hypothetical protein
MILTFLCIPAEVAVNSCSTVGIHRLALKIRKERSEHKGLCRSDPASRAPRTVVGEPERLKSPGVALLHMQDQRVKILERLKSRASSGQRRGI